MVRQSSRPASSVFHGNVVASQAHSKSYVFEFRGQLASLVHKGAYRIRWYGTLITVISLRTLTDDDWLLWRDARVSALTDAPYAFNSRIADWDCGGEEQWYARFVMPSTYNIIMELDGKSVGMASGIWREDGVSELRSLWVSASARGRGVGTELVAEVETWAVTSGASALKLAVFPDNDQAIALYRRNGFVADGTVGDLLPDGVTRELVMVKKLR